VGATPEQDGTHTPHTDTTARAICAALAASPY